MRVTAVDMYSANLEEAISFSLLGSDRKAEYEVRQIIGLDADEIVPKFYANNISGDKKFYNFGMKPREIVLRVILKPRFNLEENYADVRDRLYKTISANRTGLVTLQFKDGGSVIAQIEGSIIKFEAVHFTKLPEVQLTIKCNDPMLRAINPVVFSSGEISETNPIVVPDSISNAPHGFMMEVVFTGTAASFTIQDAASSPEWMFKVTPSGGFLSGDHLHICSDFSNRCVYMVRSGITTQLADKLDSTSVWPIIFPGSNSFHFVNIASVNWVELKYYPSYWGV